MQKVLIFTLLTFATSVQAHCRGDGTPLFHCTFEGGAKMVDVCLQGAVLTYSFGKIGRDPDIVLARRETHVGMTPWNGIGRTIWEEISFYNQEYSYNLSYANDRMTQSMPTAGRLVVGKNGREIAVLECDIGSVSEANFYPLFTAKEQAGQRYCPDTFMWGVGC